MKMTNKITVKYLKIIINYPVNFFQGVFLMDVANITFIFVKYSTYTR